MKSRVLFIIVHLIWINGLIELSSAKFRLESPWSWTCNNNICEKSERNGLGDSWSFSKCKLICGKYGSLWPRPKTVNIQQSVEYFSLDSVSATLNCKPDVRNLLQESLEILKRNVQTYNPDMEETHDNQPLIKQTNIELDITVEDDSTILELSTDESYNIDIKTEESKVLIVVGAKTFFGARHALQTLHQLVNYDEEVHSFQIISSVTIDDSPAYKHRGIALDTSRNFFPVDDIKRTMDAMAANKLNVLHWHITDSHSFPLMLNSIPNMAYYGAYTYNKMYYPEDILHLIEYAKLRGIRIIPEIDMPAHVGNGWQWGKKFGLGDLAVCVNQDPWTKFCVEPPCGQLNIANENIYDILGKIFVEIVHLFQPLEMFHFGGDEVHLNCWNSTQEIIDWMLLKGDLSDKSYYREWGNFQKQVQNLFDEANEKDTLGILWNSHLTDPEQIDLYLDPKKNIIQLWTNNSDPLIKTLLEKDFKIIFSNYDAWYFDCGLGAWVGDGNNWCSPYIGWQLVYNNSLTSMAGNYIDQVLGGEAALWSEQTDEIQLDQRLWPRGAAMAERLWSDPKESWEAAEIRFVHHRQRLVTLGIKADRIQPEWCHQNEGKCVL